MYVGIDAHKKYCTCVIMDEKGNKIQETTIDTTNEALEKFSRQLPQHAKVVVEASTSGVYVYDHFHTQGFEVIMAHPQKVKAIAHAKIKTDRISAEILAHLLRTDLIPEAYVPPHDIRELRDLVRHRVALARMQASIKNKIHALLTKEGIRQGFTDLFGRDGRAFLKKVQLNTRTRMAVDNYLTVIDIIGQKIREVQKLIDTAAEQEKPLEIQALTTRFKGIGVYTALLIVAEIGDIRRFPHYKKLCSWVGLIPSTSSSGGHTYHGKITKQGNTLVRWSMIQAAWRVIRHDPELKEHYNRLKKRIGSQKAIVATARKLTKNIYFVLQEVSTPSQHQNYDTGHITPISHGP